MLLTARRQRSQLESGIDHFQRFTECGVGHTPLHLVTHVGVNDTVKPLRLDDAVFESNVALANVGLVADALDALARQLDMRERQHVPQVLLLWRLGHFVDRELWCWGDASSWRSHRSTYRARYSWGGHALLLLLNRNDFSHARPGYKNLSFVKYIMFCVYRRAKS